MRLRRSPRRGSCRISEAIRLCFVTALAKMRSIAGSTSPGLSRPYGRSSMEWDTSPKRMAALQQSIRPILTDVPLRQALSEDFLQDCANLPIAGGWGYTQREAIIFLRQQFPRPSEANFVGLEYHIVQKIIYEEMIIFSAQDDRFSGIDLERKSQELITESNRIYDSHDF